MAEIRAELNLKGWNAAQLALRVPTIIRAYGDVMDKQLKEEIKAVQYDWPRKTRRRNGTVVASPRDIVDTGRFLRSQRRDYPDATTLRFTWDARSDRGFMYAGLILTGGTIGPRSTPIPPRNWIKRALDKHPLDQFFIREWRKLSRADL
jgi:hypothetical protein